MCDYQGPSILTNHRCVCVDGRLYAHIIASDDEMDDTNCPCPSCNLDAWVAHA